MSVAARSLVDLNADMGESFGRWPLGDDAQVMKYISSANIACGYHAGDPNTMRETVALAVANGVDIGAHVGLPDLVGFGRRRLAISPQELYDDVLYQAGALQAFAAAEGAAIQHVKPHGILFVMVQEDPALAEALARATASLGDDMILLLAGSAPAQAARAAGIGFVPEGYVDLDYAADGTLLMKRIPRDPVETAKRALRLVREGKAPTVDGGEIDVVAHSICVHGDSLNAAEIVAEIRRQFAAAEIEVEGLPAVMAHASSRGSLHP